MKTYGTLLRAACAASIAGAACGGRAEPAPESETRSIRHLETGFPLAGGDLERSAVDYVLGQATGLGLSTDDGYQVVSLGAKAGVRHARLQQIHAGVPVFGAELVVRADETTFLGFNGYLTSHLEVDTSPALSAEEALAIARDDLAGAGISSAVDEGSELVILPGRGGRGADLAWRVEVFTPETDTSEAGAWSYFVDAVRGAVLWKFDGLLTLAQGSGPGGKSKKNKVWLSELDVESVDGAFAMETARLTTLDRRAGDQVVSGPDLGALPDPEANDAHGYSEIALDAMRAWLDRDSIDDAGYPIVSLVHDEAVCPKNACWKDGRIYYGRSWARFWTRTGALDVVAHEIGHGFTEFHSNLTFAGQSGGLSESFSDVAGTVAEHFHELSAADFDIGEDIWVFKAPGAERYMCDPTHDKMYYPGYGLFSSIDHARYFEEGMDPHFSSGPPNRAFCLAVGRTMAARDIDRVSAVRTLGAIWYLANASFWTSGSDYADGCRGTLDAARAIGHSNDLVAGIAHSWADVGVDCEDSAPVCLEDDTCDPTSGETCASCPGDCGSCEQSCSFWKRSKCKVGIGDCSQCSDDSTCGDGLCDGDETDGNCARDCGCEAVACGEVAPFGCFCDSACDESGDCCSDRDSTCDDD